MSRRSHPVHDGSGSLVVIPTYEEACTIERALRGVNDAVPAADVLVVDDNSPDGTAEVAEALGREIDGVHVMRRAGKDGLGRAYLAGFAWAVDKGYRSVVEMDADGSHDPADLPALLAACDRGADVAIGSRYVPGGEIPEWPWHRRLLSRAGNRYSSVLLSLGVRDATSGFRAYRSSLLRRLDLSRVRSDGYGFQIEMTYRAARHGARIAEVPITFVDRVDGESKMSPWIVGEALVHVTGWGAARVLPSRRRTRRTAAA